jgi:hypothetical protein
MHPYDYDMWHKTPIEEYDYFFHNKTKNLFIFLPRRKAIKDKGVYELKLNIDFGQSNFLKQFKHIHMLLNLNFFTLLKYVESYDDIDIL